MGPKIKKKKGKKGPKISEKKTLTRITSAQQALFWSVIFENLVTWGEILIQGGLCSPRIFCTSPKSGRPEPMTPKCYQNAKNKKKKKKSEKGGQKKKKKKKKK